MQSGRVAVGAFEGGAESKRVDVAFSWPFPDTPTIVLCAEGQDGTCYPDSFGTTVVCPTNAGFAANVGRQYNGCDAWGQELQLCWFAVFAEGTDIIQCGTVDVGQKLDEDGPESAEVEVTFPVPFPEGSEPVVMCSAVGEDYPDSFACTLRMVDQEKAIVRVGRTVAEYKIWGQELKMNWIATTMLPCGRLNVGPKECDDQNSMSIPNVYFGGKVFKKKPMVFCVSCHEDGSEYPDVYASCITDVKQDSFQMNLSRVHPEVNGWGMQLKAHYIVVP